MVAAAFILTVLERPRPGARPTGARGSNGPSASRNAIPLPLLLLRVELWGAVIGTVLMVRYLEAPAHHHLILPSVAGAFAVIAFMTCMTILRSFRLARRANRSAAK